MTRDGDMDLDSYQKAWHAQSSQTRVTIASDLLLKEVQRSQRNFGATIFHRDFREVVIGLLALPLWFLLGYWLYLPWTWYLGVPAITWVVLFILVDRIRHRQRPSVADEPMLDCVKASLAQVEHQMWLLRNVLWWHLLPLAIAVFAFFVHNAWLRHSGFWPITLSALPYVLFFFVVYGFVYYLNRRALSRDLEPRRRELQALLASLGDETNVDEKPADDREQVRNPGAWWQSLLVTFLCAVFIVPMFFAARMVAPRIGRPYISNRGTPAAFARLNSDLRRKNDLVGLAAVVSVDGKVVASAVDGERRIGSGIPVELSDQWHLGGITTSITATMIARLIEKGELSWATTVGESFPDVPMDADWKSVTFEELLTHTSGAPPIFGMAVDRTQTPLGPERAAARRQAVLKVLASKPENPPGEKFVYSNVGPSIAAAMAEKKTGATWEELVQREVFEPLGLASAGFGPPKSPDDTLPQPQGHRPYLGAKLPAGDNIDNSPVMAPSGAVHMSLDDLVTYATEHLRGQLGEAKLLSAESYRRLHAPRLNQFAYGWGVKEGDGKAPYTIYWHNGSNTLWYALVVFIPEKNMVVAVASNDGDIMKAEAAAWEIVKSSVNESKAEGDPR